MDLQKGWFVNLKTFTDFEMSRTYFQNFTNPFQSIKKDFSIEKSS